MNKFSQASPRSGSMPHQIHLQHHLLPCTAYMIIVKHKQIGWANKIKHMHTNHIITIAPKEFISFDFTYMAATMSSVFYVFWWVLQGVLLPHLQATFGRARVGNHATDHTSQDYQTRQLITEESNLIGPISTRHNVHTHSGNTRQPEPQLKSSSCSSAIPSHNSRDVIPSHNSRNATCLNPISSHDSRDTFRATT